MDNEELKENMDKNTAEEKLNTQSTENDDADQENNEKNLGSERKEVEKQIMFVTSKKTYR